MQRVYDPERFLDIANNLLSDTKYEEEGRARTAIGRAYYSAFLFARKRLRQLGNRFSEKGIVHREVIHALMSRRRENIGSKLDALREQRVNADYYMDSRITLDLGKKCARLSRLIINSLRGL